MKRNIYAVWLWVSVLFVGCESLEDTYSDYAGNGMIRYMGKCMDLEVKPGWQRLEVNWKNSIDPDVVNIKLTWNAEGTLRDTLLDARATSCNLKNLVDGNYEIAVCATDKDGNASLPVSTLARPYTESHELVRTFTRGVTKYFRVKNNLVLFFDKWSANIKSLTLNYQDLGGKKYALPLTEEMLNDQVLVVKEVDTDAPVTIDRVGTLADCEDEIVFSPYEFKYEISFSSEFNSLFESKYGLSIADAAFVNNLTELELDYSFNSLEDILYFPNLKKLVLGKNRYLKEEYLGTNGNASKVNDTDRSLAVLEIAHELFGLEIERYNQHYFPGKTLPYMKEMGNPSVPDLTYLDATSWSITNSKELEGYDSGVKNLLDNNPKTFWQMEETDTEVRRYELVIDMKEAQTVHGIKIVQKSFDPSLDNTSAYYLPGLVRVEVSNDMTLWEKVTYVDENTIGNTNGEVAILNMVTPKEVRYVRMVVSDQVRETYYGGKYNIALADIAVF